LVWRQACVVGADAVAGEDLADRPPVDPESVAQLVHRGSCAVGLDELLRLLASS
jgi:hypothetical protein